MTPEIANQIGIAYGLYLIHCEEAGTEPLRIEEFSQRMRDAIDQIRDLHGLY